MTDTMAETQMPLFRRALGERFDALPGPIRQMHEVTEASVAEGLSEITRGPTLLARLIGWIARLPAAGSEVPVAVGFTPRNGAELWRRTFGSSGFQTSLEACKRRDGHLIERLWPMAFLLEVPADDRGLTMVMRGMWILGLPMPSLLWPRVVASERVVDGLFAFDVSISAPVAGLVIRYRGQLHPPARAYKPA